jgi:hypothetical protein
MNIETGAIVTIMLFVIVHTAGFIWWMSRIDTTLKILSETVKEMVKQISHHDVIYAKRTEVEKDFALRDQSINAMWKRIDEIKDKK